MKRRQNNILYLFFSLLLTVSVLGYLFSHISIHQVVDLVANIHLPLLALFFLLSMTMQLIRTIRYRLVLRATGHHPGFFRLFLIVLVRGLCVDLLPARTGELVYIYLLRSRLGVNLGAATASFALPFLFDILALAPLIMIAVFFVSTSVEISTSVILSAVTVLILISMALIHFLPFFIRMGFAVVSLLPAKCHKLRGWLRGFAASTHREVKRAREQGIYAKVFGLSVLVRVFKYVALYVLLLAMLVPLGYTITSMPFPPVFLGLTAAEMAASLPISGIAGFGAYEGAWALVFTMLGFDPELAKLTSISHHLVTQIYGYVLGLFSVLLLLALGSKKKPGGSGR